MGGNGDCLGFCMQKRGLKVIAGKSKVMVLNGEEGFEYEVHVHGVHLEHVSVFRYLEIAWPLVCR